MAATVLIVEDERKLRELARSYLGYRQRRPARVVAGLIVLVAVVAPVLQLLAHRPGALPVAMVLFGFSMASVRFALRPAGRRPRRGGRRRGAQVTVLAARSRCSMPAPAAGRRSASTSPPWPASRGRTSSRCGRGMTWVSWQGAPG